MNPSAKQGSRHRALVAVGSNIAPQRHLSHAYHWLQALGDIASASAVYQTPPWGGVEQAPFWNGVVHLYTVLEAYPLLQRLLALEQRAKRVRDAPNGPRTLDLDLLDYDNSVLQSPALTLPHPRLHLRAFVLRPLVDVAPNWLHPQLGVNTTQMLAQVDDAGIQALDWHWPTNRPCING